MAFRSAAEFLAVVFLVIFLIFDALVIMARKFSDQNPDMSKHLLKAGYIGAAISLVLLLAALYYTFAG